MSIAQVEQEGVGFGRRRSIAREKNMRDAFHKVQDKTLRLRKLLSASLIEDR